MITLVGILATAIRHEKVLLALRKALTSTLVSSNPYHRQLVEFAGQFWDKMRALPKPGDWEFWIATLDERQQEGVRQALLEVQMHPIESWTPEYISAEVGKVLKEIATRNAVARLGSLVPEVPVDALSTLAEEIRAITPITLNGMINLHDVERWVYRPYDEEPRISTGFPSIDRNIGGFQRELVFVVADTGLGKTSLLINFGAVAMLYGARVLHITFELSAENTARRYYRRLAEVTPTQYRSDPATVVSRVHHFLRFAKGSVHVLYRGAYEVTADELASVVDQYSGMSGGLDLVILDYLDLMKPPGGFKSEYEALGRLSHEVRNLCTRFSSTVISATQATRGSHRRDHLRLDQIGDSYKKAQAADVVIGLMQSDEEGRAGQARLGLLKVRENPGRGIEFPVLFDLDRMLIADLDHPNSQRLIQELHRPPDPVFTE